MVAKVNLTVISRSEARESGFDRYFTGAPCKRGHVSERYTSCATCIECCNKQSTEWSAAHPEIKKVTAKKWRDGNPGIARQMIKDWRARNVDHVRERNKVWRGENWERYRNFPSTKAGPEASKKWKQENPERYSGALRRWKKDNRLKVQAAERNREAKKRNGGAHTAGDIISILKAQRGKCAYCKVRLGDKYHVDHIKPLSRGGLNDRKNLQMLCALCNLSKGPKDQIDFMREQGRLL